MNRNPLRANWELVRLTESALRHGTEGLGSLPDMIRVLLEREAWRQFQLPNGETVDYERFADFIAAGPPRGLGTTDEQLRNLAGSDGQLRNLLDAALQNSPAIHAGNNVPSRPEGNSTEKALRRLRKDRPDLLARVLDPVDKLSAHGAMVEAGFRKRTITVPVASPENIAATLRRHLDHEALLKLAALLFIEDQGPGG